MQNVDLRKALCPGWASLVAKGHGLAQDVESHDSQSVCDAEEEEDYTRPLWRRGYFRRLILPICLSMAMFVAAALVFRLAPRLVNPRSLEMAARWRL